MISLGFIWRRVVYYFLHSLSLFVGIGFVHAVLWVGFNILWFSALGWFYFWVTIGQTEHFWFIWASSLLILLQLRRPAFIWAFFGLQLVWFMKYRRLI